MFRTAPLIEFGTRIGTSALRVPGIFQGIGRFSRGSVTTTFGPFVIDDETRQLRHHGREVHLSPKAYELLLALLAVRPRVLSKADLQERLWPDTFVAEANLSNLVAEVREALGDAARTPRFVRTAHGFGYAFCGEATAHHALPVLNPPPPVCWLVWGDRQFLLCAGEHVVGRDAGADVRLDASTVSRRHARLVVSAGQVQLEDLGSKNGTFRADGRVDTLVPLSDGDLVRFGSLAVTIHVQRPSATTDTAG